MPYKDVYSKENFIQKIIKYTLNTVDCEEIISLKLNFTSKYFIYILNYLTAEGSGVPYTLETIYDKHLVKSIYLEACLFEVEGLVQISKKRLKELTSAKRVSELNKC